MSQPLDESQDWHCGGWEGAERETYRAMAALTFDQKLAWLEAAQELIAQIHGREASLQPANSRVVPRWSATKPEENGGV